MATTRAPARKKKIASSIKVSKGKKTKTKSKTRKKSNNGSLDRIAALFQSNNANAKVTKVQKNFSTNIEFGNFLMNITSKAAGGKVKLNIKMLSKNLQFTGQLILNEKSFVELQKTFDHVLSNVQKFR